MTLLTFRDVSKSRGNPMLERITLDIPEQTLVGVTGKNGSGKSTLLELAAGLLRPSHGEIHIGRYDLDTITAQEAICFMDEHVPFPPNFTLKEIAEQASSFYPAWAGTVMAEAVDYFQLPMNQKLGVLSKGEKALFRALYALSTRAPLTLMDEPESGLDETVRREFYDLVLKEYIRHPRTIMIATHHLSEMEQILEHLVILHEGKLLLHEEVDVLRDMYVTVQGNPDLPEDVKKQAVRLETLPGGQIEAVIREADWSVEVHPAWQKRLRPAEVYYVLTKQRGGMPYSTDQ
ncbi:ABC transporter ATP-binding protein [Alkalicoccus chagannorensis]|uniref:ATP-binding cassette domain-containing protein n=1 Tax=Alkalicoccus chagannorensis TaxID=427072 RepID=UPI00042789B6|nr:ABC transporter ATP-binding protein [Alkalicoccus chagannorensis]